nr:unnamed protein product [Digitaria exilis]
MCQACSSKVTGSTDDGGVQACMQRDDRGHGHSLGWRRSGSADGRCSPYNPDPQPWNRPCIHQQQNREEAAYIQDSGMIWLSNPILRARTSPRSLPSMSYTEREVRSSPPHGGEALAEPLNQSYDFNPQPACRRARISI